MTHNEQSVETVEEMLKRAMKLKPDFALHTFAGYRAGSSLTVPNPQWTEALQQKNHRCKPRLYRSINDRPAEIIFHGNGNEFAKIAVWWKPCIVDGVIISQLHRMRGPAVVEYQKDGYTEVYRNHYYEGAEFNIQHLKKYLALPMADQVALKLIGV